MGAFNNGLALFNPQSEKKFITFKHMEEMKTHYCQIRFLISNK